MRICSFLPSATEIVFALGLGDRLVAVTHECDYPPKASRLPTITRSAIDHTGSSNRTIHNHVSRSIHRGSSIYHIDHDLLKELNPDLILTQELCEVCAVSYSDVQKAVRLLQGERKILSLDPSSLSGILESIEEVGREGGVPNRADKLIQQAQQRIDRITSIAQAAQTRPRVLALEWLDPPFIGGHWVPEMVRLAGGSDDLGREGYPSYEISSEDIADYDPEVMVLMLCGFSLARNVEEMRQVTLPDGWRSLNAVRSGQVYAVDGSAYFSRPGPRIVDGLEILAEILHPNLFPRKKPSQSWRHLAAGRG